MEVVEDAFGGEDRVETVFFFCFGDFVAEPEVATFGGDDRFSFGEGDLCRDRSVLEPVNFEEIRDRTEGVEAFFGGVAETAGTASPSTDSVFEEEDGTIVACRSSAGCFIIILEEESGNVKDSVFRLPGSELITADGSSKNFLRAGEIGWRIGGFPIKHSNLYQFYLTLIK